MVMKRFLFTIAALLCLLSIPTAARACSCLTGEPSFEFNRARAVFIGRVLGGTEKISVKGREGKSRAIEAGAVRFSVEEIFKGDVAFETTLDVESMDGTSCGPYGLTRGARYVVYAYSSRADEKALYTGVCTRTIEVTSGYAKADLDFLRNLPAAGAGGAIRGRIWADLRNDAATPLAGVKVKVSGPDGQSFTATTDKGGEFKVEKLRPGKYRVEPAFPEHYTTEREFAEVEVDDRGTAGVGFEVYADGKVAGRFTDKDGRGFNSAFLTLDGSGKRVYVHSEGEDGVFESEGAPPGEYVLSVELRHKDYNKNRDFYYPGTFNREEATVIKLGLGEKIEGIHFFLPDEFKVRAVEGRAVWEDGRAAAGVEVLLLCPQSADPEGFAVEFGPTQTTTDEDGRFRLEAFTGEVYWIEARGSKRAGAKDAQAALHSPSRRVAAGDDLKNVRLVLSESGLSKGCGK
jgi:hypothetical protein